MPNSLSLIISKLELQFIEKAVSRDDHRASLKFAELTVYEDQVVLWATDTHRVHALRLGPAPKKFERRLVDVRRILHEMAFVKATHAELSDTPYVGTLAKKSDNPALGANRSQVFGPVCYKESSFHDSDSYPRYQLSSATHATYANIARAIPATRNPASNLFVVNNRYLLEATMLAKESSHRVTLAQENPTRPLLITSSTDRWFAVVMPMHADDRYTFAGLDAVCPPEGDRRAS